jgi:hypothetical protein
VMGMGMGMGPLVMALRSSRAQRFLTDAHYQGQVTREILHFGMSETLRR